MNPARYFDNAATTFLDPRVLDAMRPYLGLEGGNANSLHSWGMQAMSAVERAREQVAGLIGAEDPSQIYFTSGATESNNWVLRAADQICISPFEHSAMREPALRRGAQFLPNDDLELVWAAPPARQPTLVSVMAVNNEIGTIWDVREYTQPGDLVHSDATQALGKIPWSVDGLDFASFSAHKFYGPKGVGALYCKNLPPEPLILGGEQEQGYRGGTLNVPGIVGMGAAAEIANQEQEQDYTHALSLKETLIAGLNGLFDIRFNGGNRTSPFIVSVSFRGIEGETLVLELDRAGYAISAGAACSSRKKEPSHVLTALTVSPDWLRGTVRISFGRNNTKEETEQLAQTLRTTVDLLRTL